MKFTLAAAGLLAVAQVAYACQDKKCGENDPSCINACVDQINKCVSDCGGGSSCYQQCISEWTPTITNSAGTAVSTSNPLGTATADISGYSTVSGAATATATGTMNTAAGTSTGAPLTGSAAASLKSASASLATAFSSATMSLQSGMSASLSAASSSIAGAASSASASTSAKSAAVESASSSAKIIYTVCAVAALALAF